MNMAVKTSRWFQLVGFWLIVGLVGTARAEFIHSINIDGVFTDWDTVRSYSDPVGGPNVLHHGIPDTHDTEHDQPEDVPVYVNHPDIDIVEYKFTHDRENLYAYFRATGEIGRTAHTSTRHGRSYVIVTIDVDHNLTTGYGLHDGGYYPTSSGYDMNMEVEFYDGAFNTGHYILHAAQNEAEYNAEQLDQLMGTVRIAPGAYGWYTQWVWFDQPNVGTNQLPPPDDFASINFVNDRGPVYQGIVRIALSPDGHQAEMVAPFRGFMRDPADHPIMALGKTIDISFSLEASPELAPAPSNEWASDTGDPIVGYYLSPFTDPMLQIAKTEADGFVLLSWSQGATGMRLEQTPSLVNPDWQNVDGANLTNRVLMTVGTGAAFFRLAEP